MEILFGLLGFGMLLLVWLAPLGIALALWIPTVRRVRALERRLEAAEARPIPEPQPVPQPDLQAPSVVPLSAPGTLDGSLEAEEALETEEFLDAQELPGASALLDASSDQEDTLIEPRPAGAEPTGVEQPPARPAFTWPSIERVVVWTAAVLGGLAAVVTALLALVAAIDRGWLGPAARTSMGLGIGTGLWVVGAGLRRLGHRWGASALAGSGVGTLYGVLFAASGLYQLLPATASGAAMVAVTTLAAARAIRHHDRLLAWLALTGGVLTPILVSTGSGEALKLFAYLSVLCVGFSFAASRRGWWDLVLGAAIAVGLLFVTWTQIARAPDAAVEALVGLLMLALPFSAATASSNRKIQIASAIGAVGLLLCALPWIVPIDPVFYDPRTGTTATRSSPTALAAAALATGGLPLPLLLASRRSALLSSIPVGSLVASVLVFTFGVGWTGAEEVGSGWLLLGAVGPALVGAVASVAHPTQARGAAIGLVASGLALSSLQASLGLLLLPGLVGLGLAALVLALSSGWGGIAIAALAALGLPLLAIDPAQLGLRWAVGATAAVLAATSQVPVLWRWRQGERLAWAAAATAGLVLFWPLYDSWRIALGSVGIGLLPLLLGANTLLGVSVLVRRRGLLRTEGITALFAALVLLGVAVAVPLQLEERWLTVAWAIEAAALAWIHRRLRHPLLEGAAVLLALVVGIRLVVNPWALDWGTAAEGLPILNWTLYTWGLPLLCVLFAARRLPRFATLLASVAVAIGFALVNVQVSHAFQEAGPLELGGAGWLQGTARSASWAGYGLFILGIGLFRDLRWVRLVGFGFVMLSAVKVFLFDVWGLAGFARVGSFGCLAVTLLVAALLFERLVLRGVSRAAAEET